MLCIFGKIAGSYDRVVEAPCVIPGLIDSHVHLTFDCRPGVFYESVDNVIKIFMIHGVLGVRDTGNALSNVVLFTTVNGMFCISMTYSIEKPPLHRPFMRPVRSVDDVTGEVEKAFVEGCSWFKLYVNIDEEIAREAVARAHEKDLRVTGHVNGIGVDKAIEVGYDCIEHLDSIARLKPSIGLIEAWENIDEGVIEEIARKMASKNIVLVPTASVYRAAMEN